MPRAKFWADARWADDGSASIEFISAGLLLLVPVMYLVLALSSVQQAMLAAEGASRHAVRVFVQATNEARAFERSTTAVQFAFADAHITQRASTTISCRPTPSDCLVPGSRVTVTVRASIPLPFIPDVFGLAQLARVPVSASSTEVVSRFHGARP
ncbi:unannotated protein [freshwater metagenome]|jgi:hypothetical protein|uniref:Unannotated protein n=1 Tax=freshwater metagenome TaxID=449393 RepID=A0A6J6DNE7_9ZZZZ|nr:hypothetical protein [Actinomycetota bacterium]